MSEQIDWATAFDARVASLNSSPAHQLFEVGPSGKLVGGDILLSKGPDDEFEADVEGVKPGVWTITQTTSMEEFVNIHARWVAPGQLAFDNLPTDPLQPPSYAHLSRWKICGGYSVDSGTHGVLDQDGLDRLIESEENHDREYIIETLADYALDDKLGVGIGFVVGGDDGGYNILARENEGVKVEIMVKPYTGDDEEDGEEGEDGVDDPEGDED